MRLALPTSALLAMAMPASAATVPFTAAFYDTGPIFTVAEAEAAVAAAVTPTATFTTTAIDYPRGAQDTTGISDTLVDLLGPDAGTLTGIRDATLAGSVFVFTGNIPLNTGNALVRVGSDDGFRLRFDGMDVAAFDAGRPFGVTEVTVPVTGPVDFELLVFEINTGVFGIEFEVNDEIVTPPADPSPMSPIPLPASAPMLAGGLALLALHRRRSSQSRS